MLYSDFQNIKYLRVSNFLLPMQKMCKGKIFQSIFKQVDILRRDFIWYEWLFSAIM